MAEKIDFTGEMNDSWMKKLRSGPDNEAGYYQKRDLAASEYATKLHQARLKRIKKARKR